MNMGIPPVTYVYPPDGNVPRTSVLKTIVTIAAAFVGYVIAQLLGSFVSGFLQLKGYPQQFATAVFIFAALVSVMIFLMKKKKALLTNGNGFWGGLLTGGFMIYASISAIMNLFMTVDQKKGKVDYHLPEGDFTFGSEQVWCILAILLSAGICEELLFRGVVLNALRDCFGKNSFKGTVAAIFTSGILFGAMHFINLRAGVPLRVVLIQVVSAAGIGVFLGTVYCRWGNLKVTMFLHFLMDICVLLPQSMQKGQDLSESITETMDNPAKYLGFIIYVGISIFLLRKSERHNLFTYSLDDNVPDPVK